MPGGLPAGWQILSDRSQALELRPNPPNQAGTHCPNQPVFQAPLNQPKKNKKKVDSWSKTF
jgi:hypothetical protein